MSGPRSDRVGALDKAVGIVKLLAREPRGLPLGEIARRLDLNPSTAHHLLGTLRHHGFVSQDPQTRTYRLGYGLLHLVSSHLADIDLYSASIEAIRELRDLSGETAYLTVLENGETVALIELSGNKPIQVKRTGRPGQTCLHSTASGKTLLAYRSPEECEALLSSRTLHQFTPNTIVNLPRLRAELAAIRRQGYALDREEDYVGIGCVAAPIFDRHDACVASASVAFLAARLANVDPVVWLVCDAARKVSANLGHAPSAAATQAEEPSLLVG